MSASDWVMLTGSITLSSTGSNPIYTQTIAIAIWKLFETIAIAI